MLINIVRKEGRWYLTFTGHTEGESNKGKKRVTYLKNMFKLMGEQGLLGIIEKTNFDIRD